MNKETTSAPFAAQVARNEPPSGRRRPARKPKPTTPPKERGTDPLERMKPIFARHLEGISDIFVAAPIKQGFIDAFEQVTYETRLGIVMETLFRMRSMSREFNLFKPLIDSAERIQSIRSFRLGVVEIPSETGIRKNLVLAATFDRPWEPYIRLIWHPLGRMLDVLFCNTEKYVSAEDHTFEEYNRWVRANQIDTGFFYATTNLNVTDLQYLVEVERIQRDGPAPGETLGQVDLDVARAVAEDPAKIAKRVLAANKAQSDEIAMEALGALYRLTSYYPVERPCADEGKYLHRAAHGLLEGWDSKAVTPKLRAAFQEWIDWYETDRFSQSLSPAPPRPAEPTPRHENIQYGIRRGYDERHPEQPITHGCLLLLGIRDSEADREAAKSFIAWLEEEEIVTEARAPNDEIYVNLAFTLRGLQNLGVTPKTLGAFPNEFLEGPERRAGLIGDVFANHPRRWRLPPRNWPAGRAVPPVDLASIDMVLQLRRAAPDHGSHDLFEAGHPLAAKVQYLADRAGASGVELLSVQSMRSWPEPSSVDGKIVTREHFGALDGFSQPKVAETKPVGRDEVRTGEVLLGYPTDRKDPVPCEPNPWLDDGSFLVVRKIRQDVAALHAWLREQVAPYPQLSEQELFGKMIGRKPDGTPLVSFEWPNRFHYARDKDGSLCPFQSHIRRANPRAKEHRRPPPRIMRRGMAYGSRYDSKIDGSAEEERGLVFMSYQASIAEQYETIQRWLNGGNSSGVGSAQNDPLTGVGRPGDPRTFRWSRDGQVIRHPIDQDGENPFVELEWMLYLFTPSIEAIRRIASSRPGADERELELGRDLVKRLLHAEKLLWGKSLIAPEDEAEGKDKEKTPRRGVLGTALGVLWKRFVTRVMGRPPDLQYLGPVARVWKASLEDFGAKDPGERDYGPAVWAAIRQDHDGVLRVPYGDLNSDEPIRRVVLVARKTLVEEVCRKSGLYSVEGQGDRMINSFGRIYVGMDDGQEYKRESAAGNPILMGFREEEAFRVARKCADYVLDESFRKAREILEESYEPGAAAARGDITQLDLTNKFITPALADICTYWFGIPDPAQQYVEKGSWRRTKFDYDTDLPRCPGDFMAPSRYMFYPDPNPAVCEYGAQQGRRLYDRVYDYFARMEWEGRRPERHPDKNGKPQHAEIAAAMFDKIHAMKELDLEARTDLLTRNVIGAMTGMLPPTDGCLRGAFFGWTRDRSLWRIQHALRSSTEGDAYKRAQEALERPLKKAMLLRPSPDMVWRTATGTHRLGGVRVRRGERLFVGIVSATMEDYRCNPPDGPDEPDVYPVFGGNRRASGHGIHACPAYDIAMGTMMGIISALFEKGTIELLPSPLMVKLTRLPREA